MGEIGLGDPVVRRGTDAKSARNVITEKILYK
jgi:hypothetical protein